MARGCPPLFGGSPEHGDVCDLLEERLDLAEDGASLSRTVDGSTLWRGVAILTVLGLVAAGVGALRGPRTLATALYALMILDRDPSSVPHGAGPVAPHQRYRTYGEPDVPGPGGSRWYRADGADGKEALRRLGHPPCRRCGRRRVADRQQPTCSRFFRREPCTWAYRSVSRLSPSHSAIRDPARDYGGPAGDRRLRRSRLARPGSHPSSSWSPSESSPSSRRGPGKGGHRQLMRDRAADPAPAPSVWRSIAAGGASCRWEAV